MTTQIDVKKINFNQLFNDFWYVIPEYQRSYVWKADNVNELLDDLYFAFTNRPKSEYFLGSLVLRKTNQTTFNEVEVLDGQQRLTTLFLMMAVIRDITSNSDLKSVSHGRIFQKGVSFAGIPERVRIIYKIRDDVGSFINTIVLTENGTLKEDELKKSIEAKNVSICNMANAIITMSNFFKGKEDLEEFAMFFPFNCVFIYVSTEGREDAFRLFTILNNRGIPLTNANILKSINIGEIADPHKQEKYAKLWEEIEADFGDDFDRFISFIRTILVKEKARANLLEEFENNVYDGKGKLRKGTETIDFMKRYKDNYDNLLNFSAPSISNDYKNLITIMRIGLPSEDWIPPLLYFYERFGVKRMLDFLKKLEYKFVADWVLKKTPTERIKNMNSLLEAIEKSSDSNEIITNNQLFAVDNSAFRDILSQEVYGTGFARYILLKYEYLVSDNTVHLSDYKTISIEHVLPQTLPLNSQWVKDFSDDSRGFWTHRLANLVLINRRKNSTLSNLDFTEKKQRYLQGRIDVFTGSKIFINQHDKWTITELEKRQKEMLDKLVTQPL